MGEFAYKLRNTHIIKNASGAKSELTISIQAYSPVKCRT